MKALLETLNNMDDESKKKIKIFGIVFVVIIALIIIISIIVGIINRKTSYENMEKIMEEAAVKYYENNLGQLPTADVKTTIVSAQTLVDQEYMKEISKYTKDESCSGNVIVTYRDGEYDYQAYLMCNSFNTTLLVDEIKKNNSVVASGEGLYDESGVFRFRGEHVNNYLKVGEEVFRIIKIDAENRMFITPNTMDDFNDELRIYWDDRYNSEEDLSCGINDYTVSRANESLDKLYDKLNKTIKENTVNYDLCINKRNELDVINTGIIECSKKIEKKKIGLLPLYEYIRASVASSCTSANSKECKNYNYLVMEDLPWWTITADSSNSYYIYYVNSTGEIDKEKGDNKKLARYVVALKNDTLFKNGKGTLEEPYEIR